MLQTHASFEPVAVTPPCTRNAAIVRLRPQAGSTVACSTCCLKGVCLPCDLDGNELGRFGEIATAKRRVPRGASLYHNGDRLESLYAVRSGAFKTIGVSRNGTEKITGFHLPGELLGLDAINGGCHGYNAVALEDSEVCIIPFAQLEQLAMSLPALQHQLLRLLSRFMLRMTREEIGSYLGLTLETVSRLLSRFQRDEWIAVHQRDVEIRNKDRLMEVVGHW